jgi:hypothetical protein
LHFLLELVELVYCCTLLGTEVIDHSELYNEVVQAFFLLMIVGLVEEHCVDASSEAVC